MRILHKLKVKILQMKSKKTSFGVKLCEILIKFYKLVISPVIHLIPGSGCRFYPTCSQYTLQSIQRYGVIKGIINGACRILRCNPFCEGGLDFVKDEFEWKTLFKRNPNESKKVD